MSFHPEYSNTPAFAEFSPAPTLTSRISEHCYQRGIVLWGQVRPLITLAHRLVALGNTEAEAVRKACELADEIKRNGE